jgi:hypothetical protein
MEWNTNEAGYMPTETVYQVKQATAQYYKELLNDPTHSAVQENSKILSTLVIAREQELDSARGSIILQSLIHVIHSGEQGLVDLAGLLMFVTSRNTTDSSFTALDQLIGLDTPITMISFTNEDGSVLLGTADVLIEEDDENISDTEKTLIIASSVLAFALLFVSIILIWVAGGWLALRKQVKVLIHREEELTRMTKQQELNELPTADEEDEDEENTQMTNPSGILGVDPNAMHGLGIIMTPGRRRDFSDNGSDIATPMSAATEYSENRSPLGIMSMRKLLPSAEQNPDDHINSLANFRVERLSY